MQKPARDGVSPQGCLKPSVPIPDVGTIPTPYGCGEVRGHKVPAWSWQRVCTQRVAPSGNRMEKHLVLRRGPLPFPSLSPEPRLLAFGQEVLASYSVPGAPLLSGSREEEQEVEPKLEGSTWAGGPEGPGSGEDRGPGNHEMAMWHILG